MLGVGFVGVGATWVCFVGASCTTGPAGTHFPRSRSRGFLNFQANNNLLLALATDGNARYLVTGDDDLLVLNPYKDVQILNPATFLNLLVQ